MSAIQALRSDALAYRATEDVKEKIPTFYNSVNQSLGQSIVQGQDSAEQLITSRFEAANKIAAELRQKLDGRGGFTETGFGMGIQMINSALEIVKTALGKISPEEIIRIVAGILAFSSEVASFQEQWKAAAATYAQWCVQAGYSINEGSVPYDAPASAMHAMGGRGAIKYRDAITPRFTDRTRYGGFDYENVYSWASVGSITRIGQY
jgi:hypothetical protein